jgi:hypothetical protein
MKTTLKTYTVRDIDTSKFRCYTLCKGGTV